MTRGVKAIWTSEMEDLLGVASDRKIAEELGVRPSLVRNRRIKLKIPPFRKWGVKWTPEMEALLGTMTDRDVADELDIKRRSVKFRRRELGIEPITPKPVEWTLEMEKLLGLRLDREVAAELGITYGAVRRRRVRLGIPSWRQQNRIIPNWMSAYTREADKHYVARRRNKKRNVLDTLTYEQWLYACEWFNGKCTYCGEETDLGEDHLVPLSKGGPRTALNIIPCCLSCNVSKGTTQAHAWIYEKFGMTEGKKIVDQIVAYLTEVRG